MSADIRSDIEKLSLELDELKKSTYSMMKKSSPEIKLRRYRALVRRISKCSEINTTPDEIIASLRRKEY